MKKNYFKIILALFCTSLFLTSIFPISSKAVFNQVLAKNYLTSHPNNYWSTIGLAALEENNIPSAHLKNIPITSALSITGPILAITALGENPKTFGNEDYVTKLKTFFVSNQLGDASIINDDIFGSLALVASGESLSSEILTAEKKFLLQSQNSDGGWSFALNGQSDTNTTASALLALKALGLQITDTSVQNGLAYLKNSQNSDGGFPYDPKSSFSTASDSSSTAWVIWALNAFSISPDSWSKAQNNPKTYLEQNQDTNAGFFKYQTGSSEDSFSAVTTAYAAIALSNKFLPLTAEKNQQISQKYNFRIEGSSKTVCQGKTEGPTALDIVKTASTLCGFNYNIENTSFGPYLNQIGSDTAAGSAGWQYSINYTTPSVGAADYELQNGDEVIWYFSNFDSKLTKLTLNDTEIQAGEIVQAIIEFYDSGVLKPLIASTITIGTQTFNSNDLGVADISAPEGYHKIFAQKEGYVRSNTILLKSGSPASSQVGITVNIGQVAGEQTPPRNDGIAFSVTPSALDFGTLALGQSLNKTLKVTNNGSVNFELGSLVTGAEIIKDNLSLMSEPWNELKLLLTAGDQSPIGVTLSVPKDTLESGQKQAQLIFWATPK